MINSFKTGAELIEVCRENDKSIAEVMLQHELEEGELGTAAIREEMAKNLSVMRASIKKGLEEEFRSITGLSGGDAQKLENRAKKSLMGERMAHIAAASMAVVEVNASMGCIVAAPTAGASGILPAALLITAEYENWSDQALINGMLTAGAVGAIIAMNASISGAEHGCQAETGSAAAMAAAALVELAGGSPEAALNAAAIALKNVLGLVCDPVAGLVECPCIKRNALAALNAVLAADMTLAGIKSMIPFDEVVIAMRNIGRQMNPDLRETARGGLAATPTAREIRDRVMG